MRTNIPVIGIVAVAALLAFALWKSLPDQQNITQPVEGINSLQSAMVVSNTTTNLHFDNLHANPQVQ